MTAPAPGTLNDDDQRRLMAQMVQLLQAAYGADAHMAITVMKPVNDGERQGTSVFTMSTVPDPNTLRLMLLVAAQELKGVEFRRLVIDDGQDAGRPQ